MNTPNIDYMMNMTKEFLNGEIDDITYCFDFPYEIEQRYREMVREHQEYSELIYDYLVEDGTNHHMQLSDKVFKTKIRKNYNYIKGVVRDGFY